MNPRVSPDLRHLYALARFGRTVHLVRLSGGRLNRRAVAVCGEVRRIWPWRWLANQRPRNTRVCSVCAQRTCLTERCATTNWIEIEAAE
jgi:hypothetical protein